MAVFLSPGVFTREIDLSILPTGTGALRPAFIGTANKGPINKPTLITSAQEYIDTFGKPIQGSYLGYAVLAYLEEGNACYVLRTGVEYYNGIASSLGDIAVDTSGLKHQGWGRIPVFKGIDYGYIRMRAVNSSQPVVIHDAGVIGATGNTLSGAYHDAVVSESNPITANLVFSSQAHTGADEVYTLTITSDPIGTSHMDGAAYVVTNSGGETVATGTLDYGTDDLISSEIDLGTGVVFYIQLLSGGPVAANDTITFAVQPDNSDFEVKIENATGVTYSIAPGTYTTATALKNALNVAIGSADFSAVANGEIVALRTATTGASIQLSGTSAFCAEVGVDRYTYDIPRSHLIGTQAGPYTFTSANNRVVLDAIGNASTVRFDFNLPVVTDTTAAAVAATINANSTRNGVAFFSSYALTVPNGFGGGIELVVITTTADREADQLRLQASFSYLACLRLADVIGVNYPYTNRYRTFTDTRTWLPAAGTDPSIPASCADPLSDACDLDSAYYENIIGWFVAKTAGSWSSDYSISLELFTEGAGDTAGRYKITVKDALGAVQDSIENISFDPAAARYIGNVVNEGSTLGGINGNSWYQWEPRPSYLSQDELRTPSAFANMAFSGGQNGITIDPLDSSAMDSAVIGNAAFSTGIYAFQNPELYDFNILATPGFSSGPVLAQAIQLCENRGDVVYLVDPPIGLRPSQVIDWHNGMLTSDLASALNTSYAALYWGWLKVNDQYNGGTIWIPPSGHIAAIFARTDRVSEQWFAPAGSQRGRILSALELEYDPSEGERAALYGSGNAVNAIVNIVQSGITVWGQRTLYRQASALDRVNVRMLCIFLKKNLSRTLRNFVFEFNDDATRSQIRNIINPFLGDIAARRGVTAFNVICDSSNNTPERIDRNELWISVFIKPTKVAEFIVLNVVLLRTGGSFSAQEVLAAGGIVNG